MDLVVGNRGEGDGGIPKDVVDTLTGELDVESVLRWDVGVGNPLKRTGTVGSPLIHLEGVGMDGTDVNRGGLLTTKQNMERRSATDGEVGTGRTGEEELILGRSRNARAPDPIGGNLMDLTSTTEAQPVGLGENVHHGDAETVPLIGIDADDLVLMAIGDNLAVDPGNH